MNVYIQRIDYDETYDFQKSEILKGRLRQGWGVEGTDLRADDSFNKFCEAGKNAGWEGSYTWFIRKYSHLRLMLEMKPGDIIIVPKINMNTPLYDWKTDDGAWAKTFTLLEVTEGYRFEPVAVPEWDGYKEFGHIIGVKIIGSYSYYQSDITGMISEAFSIPYHWNPVSDVKSDVIIGAVKELIAHHEDASESQEDNMLSLVESAVKNCSTEQLNKVITQLFTEGGFYVKDADRLIFALLPSDNLVSDVVLSVAGKFSEVRVYTSAAEWRPDAVNILVDVAGTFTDDALKEAALRGITLLKWSTREFAELLLRYRVLIPE